MTDAGRQDPTSKVADALRQAYGAVRLAVETQRRPDISVTPQTWIEQIHDLRVLMSAQVSSSSSAQRRRPTWARP